MEACENLGVGEQFLMRSASCPHTTNTAAFDLIDPTANRTQFFQARCEAIQARRQLVRTEYADPMQPRLVGQGCRGYPQTISHALDMLPLHHGTEFQP